MYCTDSYVTVKATALDTEFYPILMVLENGSWIGRQPHPKYSSFEVAEEQAKLWAKRIHVDYR